MVLKNSDAFVQTLPRALFFVEQRAEATFIRVHVPRALGPFFSLSPLFPLLCCEFPAGARRWRLRPLPVGEALMFSSVMVEGGERREQKGRSRSVTFPPSSAVRVIQGAQPPPKSPSPPCRFVFSVSVCGFAGRRV